MLGLHLVLNNQLIAKILSTQNLSKNKKTRLIITIALFSYILSTPSLFSMICIDVDDFSFPSSQHKGVRVSIFNTDTQAFDAIEYHSPPSTSSTRSDFLKNPVPLNHQCAGLKVNYNKNIEVSTTFDPNQYILRTTGHIIVPQNWTLTPYSLSPYTLLHKNITSRAPEEAIEKLRNFTDSTSNPPFNVWSQYGFKTFANISSNTTENSNERGIIGELATTLTMMSFGYFTKYPSQNGSNQGFDGVFVDFNSDYLILTESKCRAESETAKKYLEKEMNEKEVHSKISRLALIYPTTKQLIEEFIQNKPQNIFKFVQRIKPNGKSQWAWEPFSLEGYVNLTLSPASSEKENVIAFKSVISRSGLSHEVAFMHVLKAFNISLSQEQARQALQHCKSLSQATELEGSLTPLQSRIKKDLSFPDAPDQVPNVSSTISETPALVPRKLFNGKEEEDVRKEKKDVSNNPKFSEENFVKLLNHLLAKNYSAKDITKMAKYSGSNANRDLNSMRQAATSKKKEKWDFILADLNEKGVLIEDFL